jgi:multidrug efflux pump subunit AcrA (membrane-fusion protein)
MKKRFFYGAILAIALSKASFLTSIARAESGKSEVTGAEHEDPDGYYTCPMHPQVHEHKSGKCPICGMPLVKKFGNKQQANKPALTHGNEIEVSQYQLSLVGIGKYTIARKDITFTVPVSGRMLSSKEIAFQVFESDLQLIKSGLEFSGSAASSPDEILTGKVRSVDNLIDPSSRTIRVTGVLNQSPQRSVIDGSFHGEIKTVERKQIVVPEEAVLHTGMESLVYVFTSNSKLKPVEVKLGKKNSREYQILTGLNEGDVISTGPNFLLDSESKIRGSSD